MGFRRRGLAKRAWGVAGRMRRVGSRLRLIRVFAALAVGGGVGVMAAQAASAFVLLSVAPSFPETVSVGDTDVVAFLNLVNSSTPPQTGPGNVTSITLVPSCGTQVGTSAGNCTTPDPGVFNIDPTGTGGADCFGRVFDVTVIDPATGQVQFTPQGGPIVLSNGQQCIIGFTFDVLKQPVVDTSPATPGTQTFQLASALLTDVPTGTTSRSTFSDETTVLPAAAGVPLVAPKVAAVVLVPMVLAGGFVVVRRRRQPV